LSEVPGLLKSIDEALVTDDGLGVRYVIGGQASEQGRRVWVETPLGLRYYIAVPPDPSPAFRLRYDSLSLMSPSDRVESLLEASDAIDDYKDAIIKVISMETGKKLSEARDEVEASQAILSQAQELASARGGSLTGRLHFDMSGEWTSTTVHSREGVGLVLPPFTSPFFGAIAGAASLLANGMPAVVKSPWGASASTAAAVAILRGTDLGDFVSLVNVNGYGRLAEQDVTATVLFGREFTRLSVSRTFSNVVANCSGRAALLLCGEPNDVESLARQVVDSAVSNAGQACGSVRWVLASRRLGEELLDSMEDYISQLSVGSPLEGKDVGPLRTRGLVDRAVKLINDATSKGASLSGEVNVNGNYVSPLIISDVPRSAELLWTDVQAPIVSVSLYDDCSEASQVAAMIEDSTAVLVYGSVSAALQLSRLRRGVIIRGRDDSFEALRALCHVVGDPVKYFGEGPEVPTTRTSLLLL
jgi:acyl-CoA reductase-like NAD-dependent aldehyde dehydrogenase